MLVPKKNLGVINWTSEPLIVAVFVFISSPLLLKINLLLASLNNSNVGTVLSIPKIAPTLVDCPNVVLLPIVIKLSVPPPWIVNAFEEPTVIFSLLESNNKFVDFISSESIVKPPISPLVAVILPLKSTFEAVTSPPWLTLNALELINIGCVESFISTPVVVSEWPSIVNPAILPPVNKTSEPVICPLDFNLNLLPSELLISVLVIPKPPIAPSVAFIEPSKNALPLA